MEISKTDIQESLEELMEDVFGVDDASARRTDQEDNTYLFEVHYTGTLHREDRPFTFQDDNNFHYTVGIMKHRPEDNVAQVEYVRSPVQESLDPTPFLERHGLEPTEHDRLWREPDVTDEDVENAEFLVKKFPHTFCLNNNSNLAGEPQDWGYISSYDLVAIAFQGTLTPTQVETIAYEVHEQL